MDKSIDVFLPSYFSVLTADIRYNADLSASEKIFYSEITSLTNLKGYCSASNEYFCKLYNVSARTIQNWLQNLSRLNFIKIYYHDNIRKIFVVIHKDPKAKKKKSKKSEPSWLENYIENFEKDVVYL